MADELGFYQFTPVYLHWLLQNLKLAGMNREDINTDLSIRPGRSNAESTKSGRDVAAII